MDGAFTSELNLLQIVNGFFREARRGASTVRVSRTQIVAASFKRMIISFNILIIIIQGTFQKDAPNH